MAVFPGSVALLMVRDDPTVAERMRAALDAAMQARGVSDAELAQHLGVSAAMVRRWRTRPSDPPSLRRYIAAALHLDSPEMAAVLFHTKGWSVCPPTSELARHHELAQQLESTRASVGQAITLLMAVVGTVTPTG